MLVKFVRKISRSAKRFNLRAGGWEMRTLPLWCATLEMLMVNCSSQLETVLATHRYDLGLSRKVFNRLNKCFPVLIQKVVSSFWPPRDFDFDLSWLDAKSHLWRPKNNLPDDLSLAGHSWIFLLWWRKKYWTRSYEKPYWSKQKRSTALP